MLFYIPNSKKILTTILCMKEIMSGLGLKYIPLHEINIYHILSENECKVSVMYMLNILIL